MTTTLQVALKLIISRKDISREINYNCMVTIYTSTSI